MKIGRLIIERKTDDEIRAEIAELTSGPDGVSAEYYEKTLRDLDKKAAGR